MLLIEHKIWHGISPEGYRQVFTKINQNYICQQGNIILDNLRVLDFVRMSQSHVKGHRRGGVCVLRMLLSFFFFCFFLFFVLVFFFSSSKNLFVHSFSLNINGCGFSKLYLFICLCICLLSFSHTLSFYLYLSVYM